ncbi:MAG: anhydro-N-acetylmuramic acid kinase [Colwellia sp.]|nr:anhydro-N-acetylmuramic acid kinase [Colwellia sp.]
MSKRQLYIGLMSGTSADGIDLALVDFSASKISLVASFYQAYDDNTHQQITNLYQTNANEIDLAFSLDVMLAQQFSQAIANLLKQEQLQASDIIAIGNHGQTIRHRPNKETNITAPFTLQIGCCQTLATLAGIRVVGQFRKKDMVLGGQGAPLVPAFHRALFPCESTDVFVVNIGGIANITYLPGDKEQTIIGFDTGPGNALMDNWYQEHQNGRYDVDGNWAKSGVINEMLLSQMLDDNYFKKNAPKSTGREYFNHAWLAHYLRNSTLSTADIQATLTALTCRSICQQITQLSTKGNVYLCGGGTFNTHLVNQLKQSLKQHKVMNSDIINIDSDALEAMAFAWFSFAFDKKIIGNIPAVTGASKEVILGNEFNP